eukprot:s757_g5.t1
MEEEKGTSSWYKVPTWDGSPATWRAFRREMSWWVESLDLEQSMKYNLAARWLLRQSGVVRQRGEEFTPKDLEAKKAIKAVDPESGTELVVQEADPLFGLNKLLDALEGINGKSELDKKGELREQFYNSLKRKPGERISEFCTRFRTLAADLRPEGIQLPAAEQGWFLREKLGLDGIRKQLLETALNGREGYDDVEREVLRLFKDLHSADPLQRRSFGSADGKPGLMHRFLTSSLSSSGRPSTLASSSTGSSLHRPFKSSASSVSSRFSVKSRSSNGGHGRQAYATETEAQDEADDGEEELIPEEQDRPEPSLEEVLQAEAALLASDLENLEAEGAEPELLEELEAGVENAAEALVTMPEARSRINEMKRDRGYGKASSGVGDKGFKPHGNQVNRAKASSTCFDCGLPGHWKGDKECTKPGAGLGKKDAKRSGGKHVMIADTLNTECVIPTSLSASDEHVEHEVHVVFAVKISPSGSLSEALTASPSPSLGKEPQPELARDKRLVGALDSACNRTVTGSTWLSGFLEELRKTPISIRALVQRQQESESFRFGNGGVQHSSERWRLPMVLGGQLFLFWTSVVDVPSLGLLFGRDFLDGVEAVLNFNRRLLRCDRLDTGHIPLRQLAAGHFLLEIIPKKWSRPGDQKWRKFGQDGVVELQLSFADWLKKRFGEPCKRLPREHEHLITESSCHAAHLFHSGLRQAEQSPPNLVALARDGLLLWLLQRPTLRWVPMPYPSVSSIEQWKAQADNMVINGSLAKRHMTRALQVGAFNAQNLKDATHLRNRLGFEMAFMEDPLLAGMLAARSARGISHQIQALAIKEAKAEAKKAKDSGRQQTAVRELVGPRGGLPTLRQDLLKLAALLHLEVSEKDTNAMLREKCRPAVDLLMESQPKVSKSKQEDKDSAKPSQEKPVPKAVAPLANGPAQLPPAQQGHSESQGNVPLLQVQQMMAAQEARFQTMLSQVFQHVMHVQSNQMLPTLASELSDENMTPLQSAVETEEDRTRRMEMGGAVELSDEEIAQLNADYYQEMWQQRAAAGGAAFANDFMS